MKNSQYNENRHVKDFKINIPVFRGTKKKKKSHYKQEQITGDIFSYFNKRTAILNTEDHMAY